MNRTNFVDGKMVDLMCDFCSRRRERDLNRCSAFPDGIPEEIILGKYDHRRPFEGDGGKQFIVKDNAEMA